VALDHSGIRAVAEAGPQARQAEKEMDDNTAEETEEQRGGNRRRDDGPDDQEIRVVAVAAQVQARESQRVEGYGDEIVGRQLFAAAASRSVAPSRRR